MKLEKLLRNVPVTACTAARELEITVDVDMTGTEEPRHGADTAD